MIVKVALRLNATIGDDWEAATVQADEPFDSQTMDDAYDEYQETGVLELVACTTDIGLVSLSEHGRSVKPKVVLRSMLDENGGL